MKLDPLFYVKNNKLVFIEDNEPFDSANLERIEISWNTVELENEVYNEEYLANLREHIKKFETTSKFAVLVPIADKSLKTSEQIELFTNTFNHTARRLKDCINIVGFELIPELLESGIDAGSTARNFIATIAVKHAQYIYFIKQENIQKFNLTNADTLGEICIY